MGSRFSAPVQTGPGANPASCTMGTGSFPGVKSCRGVTLTSHPLLVPWSRKSRAIPLLPLWAVGPVQSLSACTRVNFTFFYYTLREVRLEIIITTHTRIKWNLRRGRVVSIPTLCLGGLSFKSRPWGRLFLFIFRVFLSLLTNSAPVPRMRPLRLPSTSFHPSVAHPYWMLHILSCFTWNECSFRLSYNVTTESDRNHMTPVCAGGLLQAARRWGSHSPADGGIDCACSRIISL